MSANIFISYRRTDSQLFCNYLSEALTKHFSHLEIFLDEKRNGKESSISPGSNLDKKIQNALDSAKIILVVIGENWLVVDENNNQRILQDDDWVHREISYSLSREKTYDDVTVIPIWIGDETNIRNRIHSIALPEDIKGLTGKIHLSFPKLENPDLLQQNISHTDIYNNIDKLIIRKIEPTIKTHLNIQSLFKEFLEKDDYLSRKYDSHKLEFLAQGSTSTLFKTFDNHSKRYVALKVLSSKDKSLQQKFDKSARAAVKLSDLPNFMTIYSLHLDGDFHFYSQQYINGRNLQRILRSSEYPHGLPFSDIHKILLNVGEALLNTHQLVAKGEFPAKSGYVFCNIKPSNLMIADVTKDVFLSPFNLCLRDENLFGKDNVLKELDQKQKELEQKQKINLSNYQDLFDEELAYLLPERVYGYSTFRTHPTQGEDVYKLADLYMLGLLAFELLTGKHPPTFRDLETLKHDENNAYQGITRESIDRDDIPHTFQEVVLKIVKRQPYDRQEAYCKFEDAIRTFKNVNYYLNLAQESFKFCLDKYGNEFDHTFIELFLKNLERYEKQEDYYESSSKKRTKKDKPAHMQLSFINRSGVVDEKKKIKHAQTLKESILFLFAYFEQSERFLEQEPNILTRVADSHRTKHEISSKLYKPFKQALIDTLVSLDPASSDSNRKMKLEEAWKHVVESGFDYMTNRGSRL
ncbi:MAG: TIR domain-containing protein [Leptolyngbya sp. SIO3F4]|nr:TIR domain-containing protein [Leptolyngbya sp. SIO3F4]